MMNTAHSMKESDDIERRLFWHLIHTGKSIIEHNKSALNSTFAVIAFHRSFPYSLMIHKYLL